MTSDAEALSFESMCRGMDFSARIHGFELTSSLDPRPKVFRTDLRPYVIAGENPMVVAARPLAPTAGGDSKNDSPWLDVKFRRGPAGTPIDASDIVAGTQVDPQIIALNPTRRSTVLAHSVALRTGAGFDFEAAAPWSMEREPEAVALAQRVRTALKSRDVKSLLSLFSIRITEFGSATGRPRGEIEAEFLDPWGDLMSEGPFTVLDEPLTFELAVSGKVAHARGPEQRPPVIAQAEVGLVGMSISFAVIRNEVRIVR